MFGHENTERFNADCLLFIPNSDQDQVMTNGAECDTLYVRHPCIYDCNMWLLSWVTFVVCVLLSLVGLITHLFIALNSIH